MWPFSHTFIRCVTRALMSLHLLIPVSLHRMHAGKIIVRSELLAPRPTLMSSLRYRRRNLDPTCLSGGSYIGCTACTLYHRLPARHPTPGRWCGGRYHRAPQPGGGPPQSPPSHQALLCARDLTCRWGEGGRLIGAGGRRVATVFPIIPVPLVGRPVVFRVRVARLVFAVGSSPVNSIGAFAIAVVVCIYFSRPHGGGRVVALWVRCGVVGCGVSLLLWLNIARGGCCLFCWR